MLNPFGHPLSICCVLWAQVWTWYYFMSNVVIFFMMLVLVSSCWWNIVAPEHAPTSSIFFFIATRAPSNIPQQGGQTNATCRAQKCCKMWLLASPFTTWQQCCDSLRSYIASVWPGLNHASQNLMVFLSPKPSGCAITIDWWAQKVHRLVVMLQWKLSRHTRKRIALL